MPNFFKAGIATSARHVVGLQEPPKNTSTGADVEPELVVVASSFLQSSTLLKDFVLRSSPPEKLHLVFASWSSS